MAPDLAGRRVVPESFRRGYENGGALQNMAAHPEYDAPGIRQHPKSGTAAPIRHSRETGCVKRPSSEATTPEIVIPAKAGIQAGCGGETPL